MKAMQRYFAVVLTVVLTGLHALPQTTGTARRSVPSPLSGAIEVIRPSVVQIRRDVSLPPSEREALHLGHGAIVLGTGFIVDVSNGYVITALHVIEDGETPIKLPNGEPTHPMRDEMHIGIALPNVKSPRLKILQGFSGTTFKVIDRDKRHDIAVLKADHPISDIGFLKTPTQDIRVHPKSASLFVGQLRDGEPIAVSGYPFSNGVLLTTSGAVATSDAINTVEKQVPGAPAGFTVPDIADIYITDVHVNPGNSGGPVYLIRTGAVVGVCVGFQGAPVMTKVDGKQTVVRPNGEPYIYNSGLSFVVPAKYVVDLLKSNNVKFRLQP